MRIFICILFSSFLIGINCQCPNFLTGDPNCDVPDCQNNGYRSDNNKTCICPTGYTGLKCEAVKPSLSPDNTFKSQSTFNFINVNLLTRYWGKRTYNNIQKAITSHLTNNQYSSYFLGQTSGHRYLSGSFNQVQGQESYDITKLTDSSSFNLSKFVDTGLYWCYEVDIHGYITQLVKENKLRDTVITIATQHPPITDKAAEESVKQLLLAFGIKVNVLWTSDVAFIDCTNEQIGRFKKFTEDTGGLFVQLQAEEGDVNAINLISKVLMTHSNPQYIAIRSIEDCSTSQPIDFIPDSSITNNYYFVYLGVNARPSGPLSSCGLTNVSRSYDKQVTIFQTNGFPICQTFSIIADGACSAIVFTNAGSDAGVNIFSTFVEKPEIESSRYAIIEDVPFYASIHLEKQSTDSSNIVVNSIDLIHSNSHIPLNAVLRSGSSSFEYVTSNTVSCSSDLYQYLRVNYNISNVNSQRTIRINCLATPPIITTTTSLSPSTSVQTTSPISSTTSISTTIPTTTTIIPTTTTVQTTSTASTTSIPTTALSCETPTGNSTFLFIYPNDFNQATYSISTHIILTSIENNKDVIQYGNSISDSTRPSNNNTFYSYSKNDYGLYLDSTKPGTAGSLEPWEPSNVIDLIQSFLKSARENSILTVFLNRGIDSTVSDLEDAEYIKLVNFNIKIFIFVSRLSLVNGTISFNYPILNKLASLSNGHFIVADDKLRPGEVTDFTDTLTTIMQNGYSRELILSRNIGASLQLSTTSLGSLVIDTETNITVTVTPSITANSIPTLNRFIVVFKNIDNSTPKIFIDSPVGQSNFYTGSAILPAGSYQISFHTDYVDVLLRVWADKTNSHSLSYISLNGTTPFNPNNIDGAGLQLSVKNSCLSKTTIQISGCDGQIGTKYDTVQSATPYESIFNFVPYFCEYSSKTKIECIGGTENKYDIQISGDNYSVARSFICELSSTPIEDKCKNKDIYGNNLCTGESPFKRGPTGQLTDCSGHGSLEYRPNLSDPKYSSKFECQCYFGFSGVDCSTVTCPTQNTDYLTIHDSYRTYTVVIGVDADHSAMSDLLFEDASGFLSLTDSFDESLWKYQLFVSCVDGQIENVYSGEDLNSFQQSFNFKVVKMKCDQPNTPGAVDLTEVYSEVVRGLGKNVKGVIAYFTESSQNLNITLDKFLSVSQTYQQKFFVISSDENCTNPLSDDISQAAISTGGFVLQSATKNDGPVLNVAAFNSFIGDILKNKVSNAYIGSNISQLQFDFFVPTATNVYIIFFKRQGSIKINNGNILGSENCVEAPQMVFCKVSVNSGKNTISGTSGSIPYSVIVYAINDVIYPQSIIISESQQDKSDAVSTSVYNTQFAISIPTSYSLVPNDNDQGTFRLGPRNNCHFNYIIYSIFDSDRYSNGLNILEITLKSDSDGNKYTRYIPISTTSQPECLNGGSFNKKCDCLNGFSGSDCSFVDCSTSSLSNTWSDVCVCSDIYDKTCAAEISKPSSIFTNYNSISY